jgi:uncharacterized protein (TIGR03067 family)
MSSSLGLRVTATGLACQIGMKKTVRMLSWAAVVLLGASGCSSLNKSGATALQGSWNGRELGASPDTPRHVVFTGTQFDYRGGDADDWGKGTFVLREDTNPKQLLITLSDCGPKQYVGKTCCMIYQLEDGTLTAAASEPGNPAPTSFDAPGARRMVFRKE